MPAADPKLRLLVRHSAAAQDVALAGELLRHLEVVQRFAGVDIWTDARIRAGDDTRQEIQRAIEQADVALLLLSADFFASDGLVEVDVPQFLERHRAGKLRVIPVLLRSCLWEVHPWLNALHPLPKGEKSIGSFSSQERDHVLKEVVKEILGLGAPSSVSGTSLIETQPKAGGDTFLTTITGATLPALAIGPSAQAHGTMNVYAQNFYAGGAPAPTPQRHAAAPAPTPTRASATDAATPTLASVYLSYGDEDLPFARQLYEALEAAGVPVFFRHEHAVLGAHRHRSARSSLREYEHVILLCSGHSLRAASVMSELDEMLSREFDEGAAERIIPVLLDDFASTGWQPRHPDLRRAVLDRVALDMQGAEADRSKFDKAMKRLLGALKG